ncbi:MAG: membrane protein insertion efficiency factor YidD [Planctomycetes bacterium]|nr:membrane protein insertion efficiency factor YidD [Planctomycetota bacterium]HPF14928.1 membrane protein insertion efficiency factor YidD [Planctomycetota bacterium]HRV82859.1 membrane protein insertion efficiency factor YidD [Planctomycetota bacterium]
MSSHLLRQALVAPVRLYRRTLSRITPATCRFHPSCSAYCIEAVERRGVLVGLALTLWRLLRCHPLCRGGYDPVPLGKDSPSDPLSPHPPQSE